MIHGLGLLPGPSPHFAKPQLASLSPWPRRRRILLLRLRRRRRSACTRRHGASSGGRARCTTRCGAWRRTRPSWRRSRRCGPRCRWWPTSAAASGTPRPMPSPPPATSSPRMATPGTGPSPLPASTSTSPSSLVRAASLLLLCLAYHLGSTTSFVVSLLALATPYWKKNYWYGYSKRETADPASLFGLNCKLGVLSTLL